MSARGSSAARRCAVALAAVLAVVSTSACEADEAPGCDGAECGGPAVVLTEGYEVEADTDGDGALSPGESADVLLFVRNDTGDTVSGLQGAVTTATPGVTVVGCRSWGQFQVAPECARSASGCDCADPDGPTLGPGGSSLYPLVTVRLSVAPGAAANAVALDVVYREPGGRTWPDQVVVPVAPTTAHVALSGVLVDDGEGGDGRLSPGEPALLAFVGVNDGAGKAVGVSAAAVTTSPWAAATGCRALQGDWWGNAVGCVHAERSCDCRGATDGPDLEAGGSGHVLEVAVALAADAPVAPLTFTVTFADALGNVWEAPAAVPVAEQPAE